MKVHEKRLVVVMALAVVFVLAACAGGSEDVAPTTAVPEETAVESAVAEPPTPDPAPPVTDEQRIDSVVAQFEVDVAAGDIASVFAYDLLDTKIDDDGDVTLTICAWEGDSVFDRVRDSIYRTRVDDGGAIVATHITTPLAAGDCLNTQLIDSALEHVNAFDEFIVEAGANPAIFQDDPRRALLTEEFRASSSELYEGLVTDESTFQDLRPVGSISETAVAELLWRRFSVNGVSVLEVGVCRDMVQTRGLYRDGVLIDDGRGEDSPDLHSIDSFQLVAPVSPGDGWRTSGGKQIIWSDCFFAGTWLEGANIFQPRDTPFVMLDS